MHRIIMWYSSDSAEFVIMQGLVVFDTEAEVDALTTGLPTIDHGVLVEPRTGFEEAERGAVPSELDLGAFEEGGWNWLWDLLGDAHFGCFQSMLIRLTRLNQAVPRLCLIWAQPRIGVSKFTCASSGYSSSVT